VDDQQFDLAIIGGGSAGFAAAIKAAELGARVAMAEGGVLAAWDTRGFVKLVAEKGTRKLLSAHILATEAGEMITEPALAIKYGLRIEDLTSTFHPYLTLSEGIKLAAQAFTTDVAKLSCCAA